MAKKQEIRVKTVYDGKQTEKQAFVKLIIEKYRIDKCKATVDKSQAMVYNDNGLNNSGLCG